MRDASSLPIALAVATAMSLCGVSVTSAEIRIEGTRDALRISTAQEPVSEGLATLARSFAIRYRSSIALDAAAGMKYSGTLLEVTSRLLEQYNYVLKRDQDETEIIILGKRTPAAIMPVQNAADKGITSRWR